MTDNCPHGCVNGVITDTDLGGEGTSSYCPLHGATLREAWEPAEVGGGRQSGKRSWMLDCIMRLARTQEDYEGARADFDTFGLAKLSEQGVHIPHRPNSPAGHYTWIATA